MNTSLAGSRTSPLISVAGTSFVHAGILSATLSGAILVRSADDTAYAKLKPSDSAAGTSLSFNHEGATVGGANATINSATITGTKIFIARAGGLIF
jgi:hypothetical protein